MNAPTLEQRVKAIEDRLDIQTLAARFSDAVNQREEAAFVRVWATESPIWQIGHPFNLRAEGIEQILAMLRKLMSEQKYFMQMTHSGVITVDGDRAVDRFVMRERARGDNMYYDNLAVYDDVLVREVDGWRFLKRTYSYRFLDQTPFAGDAFPVNLDKASHDSETKGYQHIA
jgi:SnoaL-like domain